VSLLRCDPFYVGGVCTVYADCCGNPNTIGSAFFGVEITASLVAKPVVPKQAPPCPPRMPEACCQRPGLRPKTAELVPGLPALPAGRPFTTPSSRPSSGDACCTPLCGGPVCSAQGAGGRGFHSLPPAYSVAPVRYSTGELALVHEDLIADGYGVPWGHTRSYANRLWQSESLGQGFNWLLDQWPCAVADYDRNMSIVGRARGTLWFQKTPDGYTPEFDSKETLVHDTVNELYRLYELDGSYTEFDDFTGMFRRQVDAAGNQVEVKGMHGNGFNFSEVERVYTAGGETTTEQFYYEYDAPFGDVLLTRISA
jgi:hypothetical protein